MSNAWSAVKQSVSPAHFGICTAPHNSLEWVNGNGYNEMSACPSCGAAYFSYLWLCLK